ncbi:DUF6354 family protein [Streptomyces sp. NBC_01476]|uniref:DUF6354 family protein n=1 Tax=Streptomyces sp. NBC_01476 TaxID=2903881 RepID=UPI002E34B8B8|nr:DUF6354 family protein [Streptomyces sp. NBC_01476]
MRTIREQQLYRDLAVDMIQRDRRLRVTAIGPDGRAECLVEHDLHGTTGRVVRIRPQALRSPAKYELLDEAPTLAIDPRYTALLKAMNGAHRAGATPRDYAQAAWDALGYREATP